MIEYGHPTGSKKPSTGFDYQSGTNRSVSISSQDFVINLDQPKATLLSILFEPNTKLEDSITYDITAWSLPYAMGLEAYAFKTLIPVQQEVSDSPKSYVEPDNAQYAYMVPWRSFEDGKFLAQIQKEGVKVRAADHEFTVEGKYFPRGSLIMTKRNNENLGEEFHEIVKESC